MQRPVWCIKFVVLLAAVATLRGQATLSFLRHDVPVGAASVAMATADFNGDRKPDIALATVSGTVSVLLGRGDGGFDSPRQVSVGPLPVRYVISADVNGDGRADLVATNMLANVVSVALGRGDGNFGNAQQFPAGASPTAVVAADFNKDGKLDLAVTNTSGLIPSQAGTTVTVLLGKGDGTFGAPLATTVIGQRPWVLAAGDFNRDGKADLVVVNSGSPGSSLLIGNGDGTFQPARALPAPAEIYGAVAVADFNLDQKPDIALLMPSRVWILLGNGDGSFQTATGFALEGMQLTVADINGDNVPDLAAVNPVFGVAVALIGRGDGSFEEQAPFQTGPTPVDIVAGDFNGDGKTDMVAADQGDTNLTVLLNTTRTPEMAANGMVNAASFVAGPLTVAPGEIVTLFGRNMGSTQLITAALARPGFLDTALGNTRVLFDGVAAPLIYVREDQISAVVPYGVSGKNTTQLQIAYGLTRSAPVTLRVVAAVPGIFTADSSGRVAAVNQDGTYNSPSNPAAKGSVITFFATGEGQTDPPGIDGKLAVVPLPAPVLPVVVSIGNLGAEIRYAGAAPGLVAGLLQINARIPPDAPSGPRVPLVIKTGDVYSQPAVSVAIQ